ncbi:hypothetical protein [Streptomyces kaempferi]|uniref:Uncharacterized protein n=1 Tax=Streptomyces kaempferi TaxID=333725 RepID=A0ABW3XQJ4_9ACTN
MFERPVLSGLLGQALEEFVLGDSCLAQPGAAESVVKPAQVVQALFQRVQQGRREAGAGWGGAGRENG